MDNGGLADACGVENHGRDDDAAAHPDHVSDDLVQADNLADDETGPGVVYVVWGGGGCGHAVDSVVVEKRGEIHGPVGDGNNDLSAVGGDRVEASESENGGEAAELAIEVNGEAVVH